MGRLPDTNSGWKISLKDYSGKKFAFSIVSVNRKFPNSLNTDSYVHIVNHIGVWHAGRGEYIAFPERMGIYPKHNRTGFFKSKA